VPGRCFLAITLPDPVLATLASARRAFLEQAPAWAGEKWVRPGLLHVTVAFLGDVPDERLPCLLEALRSVGAVVPPIELHLSGVRAVPSQRRASMVWALLDGDVAAATWVRDEALLAAGRSAEGRPFAPHVTLVRARGERRVHHPALQAAADVVSDCGKAGVGTMSVPSLTVFSSTLDGAGPTYRELARIELAGRP